MEKFPFQFFVVSPKQMDTSKNLAILAGS